MATLARESAYLIDLFQAIARRGRQFLPARLLGADDSLAAADLARRLVSSQGEASGAGLARLLLHRWNDLDHAGRLAWFRLLADEFGPAPERLEAAVAAWRAGPDAATANEVHRASEPLRQELFRRINLAPGGTAALVAMREDLLEHLDGEAALAAVDADFAHLLTSWFNRGFLLLRRIDWSSPADLLEKIILYEAVHEIRDWDELRRRVEPPDRRCFAFFHPQMPDEPLIFVAVALTEGMPGRMDDLLRHDRAPLDPERADTAAFYSITNTQAGLKGISFGHFLIKQVVEELAAEFSDLKTFVTLSPLPGFADWLAENDQPADDLAQRAARYLVNAKSAAGRPRDPVARFHLGNGARLERVCAGADSSAKGLAQSHGVMANYLYDLASIERNHEAYANTGKVVCSASVRRLAG